MDECPVCYDENSELILLNCNHEICSDCLFKWVVNHTTCPICRDKFGIEVIYLCPLDIGSNFIHFAGVVYIIDTRFVPLQEGVPLSKYGLVIHIKRSRAQVITGVYRLL